MEPDEKQQNLQHFQDKLWLSAGDQLITDDVRCEYDEWAATYDQYIQEPNIQLTRPVAQCFDAEVIKLSGDIDKDNFKILDVAAGTGLLGTELSKHGYRNIHALDMSQKMLNQARVKKIYRKFICTTMTDQQIPIIATGEYDALTCCVSMGAGHIGPSALEEMIRVINPGGLLCFSIRFMDYPNYKEKILELEEAGKWKLVQQEKVSYKMKELVEEIYLLVYQRS